MYTCYITPCLSYENLVELIQLNFRKGICLRKFNLNLVITLGICTEFYRII